MLGQKGFSLIELIVTMTIVSVLSTIGFSLYQGMSAQNRLNHVAQQIVADLNTARLMAIRMNKSIVWQQTSNNSYRVFFFNGSLSTTVRDNEITIIANRVLAENSNDVFILTSKGSILCSSSATLFYCNALIFYPCGTARNGNTTFLQTTTNKTKSVIVSTAGRIRIE